MDRKEGVGFRDVSATAIVVEAKSQLVALAVVAAFMVFVFHLLARCCTYLRCVTRGHRIHCRCAYAKGGDNLELIASRSNSLAGLL
jgi:hypothetical protein